MQLRRAAISALVILLGCGEGDAPVDTDAPGDDDDVTDAPGDDDDEDVPGDDDDDDDDDVVATCAAFVACGGDPIGLWNPVALCPYDDPFSDWCPGSTFELAGTVTGFQSFTEDLGGEGSSAMTATLDFTLPADCLTGAPSCAALDDASVGLTCTGDIDVACDCSAGVGGTVAWGGDWAVSGSELTVDDGSGGTLVFDYCVQGDLLQLYDRDYGWVIELAR